MIKLQKLPENWVHPLGIHMGGYWGTYMDGRLMMVDRHLEEARRVLDDCGIEYRISYE
jgi:hypothetical protein